MCNQNAFWYDQYPSYPEKYRMMEWGFTRQQAALCNQVGLMNAIGLNANMFAGLQNAYKTPIQKAREYAKEVRARKPEMQVKRINADKVKP